MNQIVPSLPLSEYLRHGSIGKHDLDWFHISAAHFKDKRDGVIVEEQSDALQFGHLLHALVLENRKDFVVRPPTYQNDKNETKDWHGGATKCKEWIADQALPILSPPDANMLLACAQAVKSNTQAASLFVEGQSEVTFFCTDPKTGLELKSRPDYLCPRRIVEIKTGTNASTGSFSREIFNRRYHIQAAMQLHLAALLNLDIVDYYYVIIEKGDIPRVNVRLLKVDAIQIGRLSLLQELSDLKSCFDSGKWPGYCQEGQIGLIGLPAWAATADVQELIIGGETIKM